MRVSSRYLLLGVDWGPWNLGGGAMAKSRTRNAAVRKKNLWTQLKPGPQNYTPLSPITFLPRAAEIYPDRVAVIHGGTRFTYAQFYERSRRLAAALAARGVQRGEGGSAGGA